jgi:hypothetical protein
MTTYTRKYVNGRSVTLTVGDQTVLAARDAEDWTSGPSSSGFAAPTTPAERLKLLAARVGLTVAELKAELAR